MKFLREFIRYYVHQPEHLDSPNEFNIRSCIVFPNTRGGLFFQKIYAEEFNQSEKPVFLPAVMAWDDFVFHITGRIPITQVSALLVLHDIVKTKRHQNYNLAEFWQIGRKIYHDFRLIDAELLDAEKFYEESYEHWRLSMWNTETPVAENEFLFFCKSLSGVYRAFAGTLLENNLAYEELALRDMIEQNLTPTFQYENIFFVGVFHPHLLFEKTVQHLENKGARTHVFVDYDPYYYHEDHEAGKWYRYAKNNFYIKNHSDFLRDKSITVVGVPLGYNQVNYVVNELSKKPIDEIKDTAIVVAEYRLVLPLLKALPFSIRQHANVSMGFPMQYTRVHSFLMQCVSLVKNMQQGRVVTKRQLANVFLHPLLIEAKKEDKESLTEAYNSLPYLIRAPYSEIHELFSKFFDVKSINQPRAFIAFFNNYISQNVEHAEIKNTIDSLALVELVKLMEILHNKIEKHEIDSKDMVFFDILLGELRDISIPLPGSPLRDFQILGPLETAVLDFKNIYILGFNEGNWPPNVYPETYIPYELRRKYNLNKHLDIRYKYAYYFYRLLQHAENIYLVYNNVEDDIYGKEISHYVYQIEFELLPWIEKHGNVEKNNKPRVTFQEKHIDVGEVSITQLDETDKLNLPQDVAQQERLSLSFSQIYDYLTCPYRYLLKYKLQLTEPDKQKLDIDRNVFGTYVHKIFDKLFKELTKNTSIPLEIRWNDLQKLFLDQKEAIEGKVFEELFQESTRSKFDYAYNALIREILHKAINNFFNLVVEDEKNFIIVETEKEVNLHLHVEGTAVTLIGILDIVEKNSEEYRILDFKTTARVENMVLANWLQKNESKKNEYDDFAKLLKNRYLFQLLFYAYLLHSKEAEKYSKISGEIAFLLNNKNMLKKITVGSEIFYYTPVFHQHFSREFEEKVLKPFVSETAWNATPSNEACRFCPYTNICYAYKN